MTTDTSARERILANALTLFADRGPDAVSVRDIAAASEVSPALILHHFGSRDGLQQEVDDSVLTTFDYLLQSAEEANPLSTASVVELISAGLPQRSPIPAYLRRLLLSNTPAGRRLFQRWYELTLTVMARMDAVGQSRRSDDPAMRAAFLLANDLTILLLQDHIRDAAGVDPLSSDGLQRWAATALDAYTAGVFVTPPE